MGRRIIQTIGDFLMATPFSTLLFDVVGFFLNEKTDGKYIEQNYQVYIKQKDKKTKSSR